MSCAQTKYLIIHHPQTEVSYYYAKIMQNRGIVINNNVIKPSVNTTLLTHSLVPSRFGLYMTAKSSQS